jgi:hypothetical protein
MGMFDWLKPSSESADFGANGGEVVVNGFSRNTPPRTQKQVMRHLQRIYRCHLGLAKQGRSSEELESRNAEIKRRSMLLELNAIIVPDNIEDLADMIKRLGGEV